MDLRFLEFNNLERIKFLLNIFGKSKKFLVLVRQLIYATLKLSPYPITSLICIIYLHIFENEI